MNSDGTFSFSFRPEKSSSNLPAYQSYLVTATLTDSNGETQEATSVFSVGTSSIVLNTDLSGQLDKDSVKASVSAQTLNGEKITVNGTYTINRLGDTEKPSKYGIVEYEVKEQVATGNFTSGKTIDKNVFAKLASGRYQIKLDANDSQGRPVTTKQISSYIVYAIKDRRYSCTPGC